MQSSPDHSRMTHQSAAIFKYTVTWHMVCPQVREGDQRCNGEGVEWNGVVRDLPAILYLTQCLQFFINGFYNDTSHYVQNPLIINKSFEEVK